MDSFPQLETERLILSQLRASDIPAIVDYANHKPIADYTLNIPYPYSENDAIYWLNQAHQGFRNNTLFVFAIRQKSDQSFMGGIGLHIEQRFNRAEIGYWLAEPFWNKGYMTEAATTLIEFGFNQLHLHKITSSHFTQNPASGQVLIKSGMHKEGELKEHVRKGAVYHTLLVYGLTRSDYEQASGRKND